MPPTSGAIIGISTTTEVTKPDHRGGALALVEIADDGAADGLAGRGTERLRHARDDQPADGGGEDRRSAGECRDRKARDHHRPAAEAVGERAEHELRDRKPHQIERDRELDARRIGRELRRPARNRRHQDVERQQPMPDIAISSAIRRRACGVGSPPMRSFMGELNGWPGVSMPTYRPGRGGRARRGFRHRPAGRAFRRRCA